MWKANKCVGSISTAEFADDSGETSLCCKSLREGVCVARGAYDKCKPHRPGSITTLQCRIVLKLIWPHGMETLGAYHVVTGADFVPIAHMWCEMCACFLESLDHCMSWSSLFVLQ